MRHIFLALVLIAAPAWAKSERPVPVCTGPVKPSLFISPMGEPFRPKGDDDDPVKRWFDQADRNHDGKLTVGEMMLDADRFFNTLDKDGNGELLPDEVRAYEENVAPEVRLYQRRPDSELGMPDKKRAKGAIVNSGQGAGRYSFLNIPNPVASADDDINRAVDRHEFANAASERFRDLDPEQTKVLTLALLPKTPAQVAANAECLAKLKQDAEEKRR